MEPLVIKGETRQLKVNESDLSDAAFHMCRLDRLRFDDVSMQGTRITNANLSDLEIDGAQLGGAYIHNIGMPPAGHPMHDPNARQRPVRFEDCDLRGSEWSDCNITGGRITDCNLSGVEIKDCNIDGMTINGIPVAQLLKKYYQS